MTFEYNANDMKGFTLKKSAIIADNGMNISVIYAWFCSGAAKLYCLFGDP